jgi:hypothetical protein
MPDKDDRYSEKADLSGQGDIGPGWFVFPPAEAHPPLFGCVYFGPIPCFAGGAPHFAMVRTRRAEGFSGNTVAVSPITSRRPDPAALEYCLELPHETLPIAYKAGTGVRRLSWVLLPMIIRVPMSHLRSGMESVLRLKGELLSEAIELLEALN